MGRCAVAGNTRRSFTLVELLVVMLIITIVAALTVSALAGATEQAREQRTRAIINKLDQLIMERYESYRTRAVPIRIPPGTPPMPERFADNNNNNRWDPGEPFIDANGNGQYDNGAARMRLYALRDLMRMEMPDRVTDLVDGPVLFSAPHYTTMQLKPPSLWRTYRRKAQAALGNNWANLWTDQAQGSECLYLILSSMQDGDKQALDYFSSSEIGDTDGDGMKEILDAWGRPIEFLRWAPGYVAQRGLDGEWGVAGFDDDGNGPIDDITEAGWPGSDDDVPATMQNGIPNVSPDPFDPLKVDPRWTSASILKPYALYPLILSAGRDGKFDIAMKLQDAAGNDFRYSTTTPPNDPYFIPNIASQVPLGALLDTDGDGLLNYGDNITNHYQPTP